MSATSEELVKKHLADGQLRENCSEKVKHQCDNCGYDGDAVEDGGCPSCLTKDSIQNLCLTCKFGGVPGGARECKSIQVFIETGKLSFPKDPGRTTPLGEIVADFLIGLCIGIILEILIRCLLPITNQSMIAGLNTILLCAIFSIYYLFAKTGEWHEKVTGFLITLCICLLLGFISSFVYFCIAFSIGFLFFSKSLKIPGLGDVFEIRNAQFVQNALTNKGIALNFYQKLKLGIITFVNKFTESFSK